MNPLTTILHSFFDWQSMLRVFPSLLTYGLENTLILAVISSVIGTVLGMVLALMGLSRTRWLRVPAKV
jgi:ABC-type amino acid transport system permease subunit